MFKNMVMTCAARVCGYKRIGRKKKREQWCRNRGAGGACAPTFPERGQNGYFAPHFFDSRKI